ncbi:hypothetical protein VDIAB_30279 [Vibrio diabolicus]|nr:hypothetical protein VDIAB_30279 [Vibrio diabolicus]
MDANLSFALLNQKTGKFLLSNNGTHTQILALKLKSFTVTVNKNKRHP